MEQTLEQFNQYSPLHVKNKKRMAPIEYTIRWQIKNILIIFVKKKSRGIYIHSWNEIINIVRKTLLRPKSDRNQNQFKKKMTEKKSEIDGFSMKNIVFVFFLSLQQCKYSLRNLIHNSNHILSKKNIQWICSEICNHR